MTGTTLFTVSCVLREWENRGLVASRRRITVLQPGEIAAVAEGHQDFATRDAVA